MVQSGRPTPAARLVEAQCLEGLLRPLVRDPDRVIPRSPGIRLVLNMTCHYDCGVEQMCHREGMPSHVEAERLNFTALRWLNQHTDTFSKVKLVGLETTPIPMIATFVTELRVLGFNDISATYGSIRRAHSDLSVLARAGLTRATLSCHRFDAASLDALETCSSHARSLGLRRPKVNAVLTEDNVNTLPNLIRWADNHEANVRLYFAMSTVARLIARTLSWTSILPALLTDTTHVSVKHNVLAQRRTYWLHRVSGATVEVNGSQLLLGDETSIPVPCHNCDRRADCDEGLFGCGFRIGADGRVYPCVLRPDLACNLDAGLNLWFQQPRRA